MNTGKEKLDLYSVLGVLPDAEQLVVAAAFRALAAKYHPDRWKGDPAVAHRRMSELNKAYGVLGNDQNRAEYDASRQAAESRAHASFDKDDDSETAFEEALIALEERWSIAVSVFPDLETMRSDLRRTSHQLAFAFVTTLLETKRFAQAASIAHHMEQMFLERYFGTNTEIVNYARELINLSERAAVRALNRLVDVLGSEVDAKVLTEKIDADFGIPAKKRQRFQVEDAERRLRETSDRIAILKAKVLRERHLDKALELARMLDFDVGEIGGGLFTPTKYLISKAGVLSETKFETAGEFVRWVVDNLATA